MKLKSFITSIITSILSIVGCIIVNSFNAGLIPLEGVELALAKTTLIVFYILTMIITIPSTITTLIASIRACFSDSKTIKIISIVLLILSLGLCVFCGYVTYVAYTMYF